jgi:kumamolisin
VLALGVVTGACGGTGDRGAPRARADLPRRLGATPPGEPVDFLVALRLPGRAALERFVAAESRASDPHPLTAAEIGDRFGLPAPVVAGVVRRLEVAGLQVTRQFAHRGALLVEGPADAVERFFSVRLDDFSDGDARFHAPDRTPVLPADLRAEVTSVLGLDTRPVYTPRHSIGQIDPVAPSTSGSLGPLRPAELARAYGQASLWGRGVSGEGQTVAVISLGTRRGDEVTLWEQQFDLDHVPVTDIVVPPAPPSPGAPDWDASFAGEVALDLEMVRATAPGAAVLNYTTRNDGASIVRVLNQIVEDGRASIVTISYGVCEAARTSDALIQQDQFFIAAEAAGINVFVASGDDGAHDCRRLVNPPDLRLAVDWPSASAHVVAVGGTTLFHTEDGGYVREEGWASPTSYVGSGGGTSRLVRRPVWQQGPGVDNGFSTGARQVPDVAAPADPASGLICVLWDPDGNQYGLAAAGGTSAAAPFWAGLTALAQQSLGDAGVALGDVKPLLYTLATRTGAQSVFHDVTTGTNDTFAATPGWDYLTGVGSPRAVRLVDALVAGRRGS